MDGRKRYTDAADHQRQNESPRDANPDEPLGEERRADDDEQQGPELRHHLPLPYTQRAHEEEYAEQNGERSVEQVAAVRAPLRK